MTTRASCRMVSNKKRARYFFKTQSMYDYSHFAHGLYVEEELEIFLCPEAYVEGRTRSMYRKKSSKVPEPV